MFSYIQNSVHVPVSNYDNITYAFFAFFSWVDGRLSRGVGESGWADGALRSWVDGRMGP